MKVILSLLIILIISGCTKKEPNNFAGCILENMTEVKNESVRFAVFRQCSEKYPDRFNNIQKGSGLGFGSNFKNRDECVIERNKNTINQNASINVNIACSCLYEKPSYDGEICDGNPFNN